MPEPTSRASGARTVNETGPPVSGRVEEAEAVAVALVLAVEVAEGLAMGLAVGEAIGLAMGLAEASSPISTSGRLLAWQPSGVSLGKSGSGQGSSCAHAAVPTANTPSMHTAANNNSLFISSPFFSGAEEERGFRPPPRSANGGTILLSKRDICAREQ